MEEKTGISKIMEDLQASMAERYDKEFNEMRFFIDSAYEVGLSDGRANAKQDIIKLIQEEDKL